MQAIFIIAIIFLSVVIQGSFLPNFTPAFLVPDLALILIIIWTAKANFNAILKWAVLAGFMVDMISFLPIGMSIFSFSAVAFITSSLSKRFLIPQFAWRFFVLALIVVVGTLVNHILIVFMIKSFSIVNGLSLENFSMMNKDLLLKPIFSMLIFSLVYWPLEKLDQFLSYRSKVIIK